jgi:hypothetical protein
MPEITEHLYHLSLVMMQPTITIKEIPKDEITRGYLFQQLPVAVTSTRKDGSQRQFLGNTIFVHRPPKKELACHRLYPSSPFLWWILWYHKINFSTTDSQQIVIAKLQLKFISNICCLFILEGCSVRFVVYLITVFASYNPIPCRYLTLASNRLIDNIAVFESPK